MKIRQRFLELQLKMLGMFFFETHCISQLCQCHEGKKLQCTTTVISAVPLPICWCVCDAAEQSLSVEDKVLLAQAASERAAIVAKYDKVGSVLCCSVCCFTES